MQFFFKAKSIVHKVLPSIFKHKQAFGQNPTPGLRDPSDSSKGRKRILIEFSSPNIAKPFHAGHLRSTIIGGFLSNLYAGAGYDVVKLNYLGDWGKQYGLLALGYERYGNENALKENPIGHLFDLYVRMNAELKQEKHQIKSLQDDDQDATQIRENGLDEQARKYFKAMCENDESSIALWKRLRDLSIVKYKAAYARLNISFDEYLGESKVADSSMRYVESQLEKAGLVELSDGAKIINFQEHIPGNQGKGLGKALIRKRNGTTLYLTRDLGALWERDQRWHFDHMIYVVAADQSMHLKQLFKVTELMGNTSLASRVEHVTFGLVQGMSTRRGTVKFLDDILRDVGDHMHEVMRQNQAKYAQVKNPAAVADILGITAVMCQDMLPKRIHNYTFNMDAMTSFEGDTGPYLQYAHARLCSISRKAALSQSEIESANLDILTEPHAINLVRLIARYPDVVTQSLKTREPTTVLTYLFTMTHALSSSYDVLRVVGSGRDVMRARLALYEASRWVLGNGMWLLVLQPVEII